MVLDESRNNNLIFQQANGADIKMKDHNDSQHCFLISYLVAKKKNWPGITEKIGTRKFWPSDDDYLHKSTLLTLARAVRGRAANSPPTFLTRKHSRSLILRLP